MLLTSFIVYSAFRFGDSDFAHAPWLNKFSWGASILGLPALCSKGTVTALFVTIAGTPDVGLLVNGMAAAGIGRKRSFMSGEPNSLAMRRRF